MKKSISLIVLLTAFVLSVSSCTKLNSGDTFTYNFEGVDYTCEVIVSKMKYVRISPVAGPESLSGSIVIPSKVKYKRKTFLVTQIAENAFNGYTSITSVELPSTLSAIEEGAFRGCTSLEKINTPQPLSTIGDNAFEGCESLTHFDLEASISTLGVACFKNCTSLTAIKFPSSFTEIPEEAFSGCTSLRELEFSSTIMKIGGGAFVNCLGVKTIKMDRSVQSIGDSAFAGCSALTSMTCLTATPPSCYSSTFNGVPDIIVTVPMASVGNYQQATGWNHFSEFEGVY